MNPTYAIEAHDLTRDFAARGLGAQSKTLRAVDQLSFSVTPGEVFGFLGPNGAGKTTTIKMLTGQLRPTAGRAWVAGKDVVTERQSLKPRIGVVFDSQNLYQRSSARENLAFYARLYGMPRSRVDAVLDLVGLRKRARQKVKGFSNGMKQRLVIARALLHEPEVLFMDEPTRGLDAHVARGIRALVAELAKQGTTVFLTTHYMEEADQLCHRVAILDLGRIVALDTPGQLKAVHADLAAGDSTTLEDVFVKLTGKTFQTFEA
jgi:ABC-2 type transport system ATP-binding protein